MKYLMYCIFSSERIPQMNWRTEGPGGKEVRIIENDGLAAAVSVVFDTEMSRESSTILAYHKTIESLHDRWSVIPLRFATVVDEESDVKRLLKEHAERYKSLLQRVDGCVEMGIRLIIDDVNTTPEPSSEIPASPSSNSAGSGTDYLASRKAHHDALERAKKANQAVVEYYCSFFEGLFTKFKLETSKRSFQAILPSSTFLSIHFLVPRKSLDSSRKVYGDLVSRECKKMMLSGPWPPYNFVLPEDY